MTYTPQEFVSKLKRTTSSEKQTYQDHFTALCLLFDQQTSNEADPTGMRFALDMGAVKTSGGQGLPGDLSAEDILDQLLRLNLERASEA